MKNLDELGVQELSQKEMMEVEGGGWLIGFAVGCAIFAAGAYIGYHF